MVKNKYIPERGDVVWLNFNPIKGHEQAGRRPAVVLSPFEYNSKTNLAVFCPITSVSKKYPFEVAFDTDKIKGVVLSDQIRSLDWKKRNIEFIDKVNKEVFLEIVRKFLTLIR